MEDSYFSLHEVLHFLKKEITGNNSEKVCLTLTPPFIPYIFCFLNIYEVAKLLESVRLQSFTVFPNFCKTVPFTTVKMLPLNYLYASSSLSIFDIVFPNISGRCCHNCQTTLLTDSIRYNRLLFLLYPITLNEEFQNNLTMIKFASGDILMPLKLISHDTEKTNFILG